MTRNEYIQRAVIALITGKHTDDMWPADRTTIIDLAKDMAGDYELQCGTFDDEPQITRFCEYVSISKTPGGENATT